MREPARILIVDDEPDIVFLLRMAFEAAGFNVDAAAHGLAALERVAESTPDLIVTDVMMPVMDGNELIQRLRSDPQTAPIPILVVSANPNGTAGADAYIRKPFVTKQLIDAARALIERGR